MPLGRPRCRGEDYVEMDLKETGCEGLVWLMVLSNGEVL